MVHIWKPHNYPMPLLVITDCKAEERQFPKLVEPPSVYRLIWLRGPKIFHGLDSDKTGGAIKQWVESVSQRIWLQAFQNLDVRI